VIVDAQVHIWPPRPPGREWADAAMAALHGLDSHAPEELLAAMDDAGVDRSLVVPAMFESDRNGYVLQAAREYPGRLAAVGRVPVEPAAGRELVQRWQERAGLLGLRVTFSGVRRGWLTDGTTEWFWPAAELAGTPVTVYAPGATQEVARIARRHPTLRITIDHLGLEGDADSAALRAAADALVPLAEIPTISVKASALPFFVRDAYPFASAHDCVRTVVAAFGPKRVFWGSDLTRLRCSYREAAQFLGEVDGLSTDDLSWIMGRGLLEWFDWPP
jgi:predicted TIM-barrel fold metal-dependent hydrolase